MAGSQTRESRPADHKSDALTTILPSYLWNSLQGILRIKVLGQTAENCRRDVKLFSVPECRD